MFRGNKNGEESTSSPSTTTRTRSRTKRKKDGDDEPKIASEVSSNETDSVIEKNNVEKNSVMQKRTTDDSKQSSPHENEKSDSSVSVKNKQRNSKKTEPQHRPLRSTRSASTSSMKSVESRSTDIQNGVVADLDTSVSLSDDVQGSLKECNVSLRKDEVEKYIALSISTNDSSNEDHLSEDENSLRQTVTRNRSSRLTDSTSLKKRYVLFSSFNPLTNKSLYICMYFR